MTESHVAEFWLVIKARTGSSPGYERRVWDLNALPRVTKKRPSSIARDECAVKMQIRIPDAVFLRPALAVEVDVPEGAALTGTPVAIAANVDGVEIPLS